MEDYIIREIDRLGEMLLLRIWIQPFLSTLPIIIYFFAGKTANRRHGFSGSGIR